MGVEERGGFKKPRGSDVMERGAAACKVEIDISDGDRCGGG